MEKLDITENYKWVSPPSETILRLVFEKGYNLFDFRKEISLSEDEFLDLIHDRITLSEKITSSLSKTLGGSKVFWVNRYNFFLENLERSNRETLSKHDTFLKLLSKKRTTSLDKLLDSFKVSSFENLVLDYYDSPKINFSKSQKIDPSPEKIADWIRNCELIAEKTLFNYLVNPFSKENLENSLGEIIALSKINDVDKILHELKELLLKSGVILLFSPSEAGNGVSGFTKTLLKKYRLIVITDRYKNNAVFWFTLLHEIAHCILHSVKNAIIHYSDEEFSLDQYNDENQKEEFEANRYVENALFTEEFFKDIKETKSYKSILRLGVKYDISSALIVAQIHRQNLAPYSFFKKVFKKVQFESIF